MGHAAEIVQAPALLPRRPLISAWCAVSAHAVAHSPIWPAHVRFLCSLLFDSTAWRHLLFPRSPTLSDCVLVTHREEAATCHYVGSSDPDVAAYSGNGGVDTSIRALSKNVPGHGRYLAYSPWHCLHRPVR